MSTQKITPFLWFEAEAEEAANFYVSVFKDSKIVKIMRYDAASSKESGRPVGSVMTVAFELEGQQFMALNGSPSFPFSAAISFVVNCETQEEVDYYWEKLSDGGEKWQCGWIKHDKFGVTWQVVPTVLEVLLGDPDPIRAGRVMQAMIKMTKIDIQAIKDAYEK